MKHRVPFGILSVLFASAIALAACDSAYGVESRTHEATASRFASPVAGYVEQRDPLPLLVPYRGLMAGIIDWSAYGIFTVAASEKQLDDSDWTAAGMAAVNIIAASTLLTLPRSELEDAERFADPQWRGMVEEMRNASVFVALAVQRKDRPGFTTMADLLADSCQACHDRFRTLPRQSSRDFANLH